jgi:hypothetical protein
MRRFAVILTLVAMPAFAVEKTIPAKTYDDVAGLPVVTKAMRRDPANVTNWFVDACFVARTTSNEIIPLNAPCASCYGPDNATTIEACRAKVRTNPDNVL